jgi:phosphate transport system protein
MELLARKETENIRKMAITMATLVEEAVRASIHAYLTLDSRQANAVVEKDGEINMLEMKIDKAVFECLALKAPVASDLRLLFSIQKMNKDLERIGDHAVNIAQAAINSQSMGETENVHGKDIETMASITQRMLTDAITCFVQSDSQLALKVLERDDQVDELNLAMNREVIHLAKKNLASIEAALELLRVSKNLERIGDLSTNIAEDVIFQAQARDIKHHGQPEPPGGNS